MSRDPYRLRAFVLADELVVEVYAATRGFPLAERFGLQSQIRRAAVSVTANLVEGCARRSQRDYLHFIGIAAGSASEVRYLIGLSARLGFVTPADGQRLAIGYSRVIRTLQALVTSLSVSEA
jgi:four helix bundle protein